MDTITFIVGVFIVGVFVGWAISKPKVAKDFVDSITNFVRTKFGVKETAKDEDETKDDIKKV